MEDFFNKELFLVKAVGAITAIGALFLNIPIPEAKEAAVFLANVQVFWLMLFTILLSLLFVRFIKYLIKVEKVLQNKYNLPPTWTFSFVTGLILLSVISSLWGYISKLYVESLASFLKIVLLSAIMVGIFFLDVFVEKQKEKFTYFSISVVNGFSISFLASIAGVYIQEGIIGYFHFYWFSTVLPILFLALLVAQFLFIKLKGKNLFDVRK